MFSWAKLMRNNTTLPGPRRADLHGLRADLILLALVAFGALDVLAAPAALAQTAKYASIGRSATPAELKAWDIDVRPDFKGLPKGQGSVRQGEVLWEAQCASCHGSFGESSEVFTPIAGGTTAADVKSGRVDSLMPGANQPQRTSLMKVATLSTLWDYIFRAMPWNAPKTLKADEVYALTAYILNLGNVLPADFTLSDGNVKYVQSLLPNRNGMTTAHALWPGTEFGAQRKPDVQGSSCIKNCPAELVIKSFLPDYARNAHGNLAEQSRPLGPSRGVDTSLPAQAVASRDSRPLVESKMLLSPAGIAQAATENVANSEVLQASLASAGALTLLQTHACLACHAVDKRLFGPSFRDIANKYKGHTDAVNYLSGKIRSGGQGVWGAIAMPPQALGPAESAQLAQWLAQGAD